MPAVTENLTESFDAVIMFTWSNWHTEPRSNRYHYATRFARHLPVFFVQATNRPDGEIEEQVAGHDIRILHLGSHYDSRQSDRLRDLLRRHGVKRPLYWVYNPCYIDYIERFPGEIVVYHATEDYLGEHAEMPQADASLIALFHRLLNVTDLAVAVTASVARNVETRGGYRGPLIVLRNGCDPDQWMVNPAVPLKAPEKIAIFQGGINARLDYQLLTQLARTLPDWKFWFCGDTRNASQPLWNRLCSQPNVFSFGEVHPDRIAELQAKATIGLIPFRQITLMKVSLPLKAYEYVASGLPVVTIPIDELGASPDLFHTATSSEEFAAKMVELAPSRWDPDALEKRRNAANGASYDHRFGELLSRLEEIVIVRRKARRKFNVLVLYDDGSTHIATVREHLEALSTYSHHNIFYLPASISSPFPAGPEADFSAFDVLIIHYSIRLSTDDHLPDVLARAIEGFSGTKIAFVQDEYDARNFTRQRLRRLGIQVLFTCVPPQSAEAAYPPADFPGMKLVPTLTGYVPEDAAMDYYRRPMSDRHIVIGYRGRRLSHHYGDLAQEKYLIGLKVKEEANARGIPTDIEVENENRIYGSAWYQFLAGARATLGTESGSNVFDHDGSLARSAASLAHLPYDAFREKHLVGREGPIRMNQISPKIFEAIRLHVALVLFEGEYSGAVKPDEHYIPLKKDYSNLDEVFAKLEDLDYLEQLTANAYRDVIESGRFSYRTFVAGLDKVIADASGLRRPRSRLISVPALQQRGDDVREYSAPGHLLPSSALLPMGLTRTQYTELLADKSVVIVKPRVRLLHTLRLPQHMIDAFDATVRRIRVAYRSRRAGTAA